MPQAVHGLRRVRGALLLVQAALEVVTYVRDGARVGVDRKCVPWALAAPSSIVEEAKLDERAARALSAQTPADLWAIACGLVSRADP